MTNTRRRHDRCNPSAEPVQRLDSWSIQFYNARSDIVHKGWTQNLKFYAIEKEKLAEKRASQTSPITYLSFLTTYGWRIFRVCVVTMVAGATVAAAEGLSVSFVHNQERLQKLCTILKPTSGDPAARLSAAWQLVRELHEVDWDSLEQTRIETIIAAGHALLQTYLETSPEPFDELSQDLIASIVFQGSRANASDVVPKYEELAHHLGSHHDLPDEMSAGVPDPLSVVQWFADYAQWNGTILLRTDGQGV